MKSVWKRQYIPLAALLSLGLFCLMGETAFAHQAAPTHAKVLSAIPAIGSTVAQAPQTVTVFTAENINPDPKKSNLFVYGPTGELISKGDAKVSLSNPKEMSVALTIDPTNSNGIYIVQWLTVSALDGDPDQGAFVFTVKPGAAVTPTPVPTTTTSQVTPPPATTSGTPLWVPIVVGVLALAIGLGGGIGIGRQRSAASLGAMRKAITQEQPEKTSSNRP